MTLPKIIYGTAWKEEETERLVGLALRAGYRAIDTANQRKHYFEAGVGAAIKKALADGLTTRAQLFLQTKFTDRGGQDQRLPYDPKADPATQVRQSFESSLEHLGTDHLDSYVLHGPSERYGISAHDWLVWHEMERLKKEGRTHVIGVSNVDHAQLEALVGGAEVKPAFVQNRCYARHGWDREVREFCRAHQIAYQGFSLLTANPAVVGHAEVIRAAAARKKTPAQLVLAYCVQLGILPLTGSTSELHLGQDLAAVEWMLEPKEIELLDRVTAASSR